MLETTFLIILCVFYTTYAIMNHGLKHDQYIIGDDNLVKQPLPYFRRKVEEVFDETSTQSVTDDPQSHLVSFLVQNVKKIFKDAYEPLYNVDVDSSISLQNNLIETSESEQLSQDMETTSALMYRRTTKPKVRLTGLTLRPASIKVPSFQNNIIEASEIEQITEDMQTTLRLIYRQTLEPKLRSTRFRNEKEILKRISQPMFFEPELKSELNGSNYRFLYNNTGLSFIANATEDTTTTYNLNKIAANVILHEKHKTHMPMLFLTHKKTGKGGILLRTTIYPKPTNSLPIPKGLSFLKADDKLGTKGKMIRMTTKSNESTTTTTPTMLQTHVGAEYSTRRFCTMCDNVVTSECGHPHSILLQTTVCAFDEPLCYSQHTPFGIVDRGCFSITHNLTVYVCACNLCNYISITDMPIIFARFRDWVANVYELTHLRRLNKSVHKDMACLKCEVNMTNGDGNPVSNSDCLEGRVDRLPTEECPDNHVCAVKGIKNQGYVWRGCVDRPLYNYYMTLCDSDLCNNDPIVSIYDIL